MWEILDVVSMLFVSLLRILGDRYYVRLGLTWDDPKCRAYELRDRQKYAIALRRAGLLSYSTFNAPLASNVQSPSRVPNTTAAKPIVNESDSVSSEDAFCKSEA
jgi:hypothetical protein